MSKIETGGPAFPFLTWKNPDGFMIGSLHEGMTIRDHFAGQALMGLVAFSRDHSGDNKPEHFARWSYALADAMLAARGGDRD